MYITEERKAEIFGKEYITTQELREVFNLRTKQFASKLMKKIKTVVGSDCDLRGKIWTQDFFDYYNIRIYADGSWFIPRNYNEPRKCLVDGRKLKIARKKQGLTQAEAAKKCGMNCVNFTKIENEKENPSSTSLDKIVKGLSITVDDITKDEHLKTRERIEAKREAEKEKRTAIKEQFANKGGKNNV